jgi:hypothetical protein
VTRSDAAALYEKAIATQPGVERKGASSLYTSLNGHMFSMFTKDGRMALRLPEPERGAFLRKYKTILCEQYGIVQREYVIVPESLLSKTAELGRHVAASYAYVKSLKPKPTTKAKSGKTAAAKSKRTTKT